MKLSLILLIASILILLFMACERAEALDAYVEELRTSDNVNWICRHIGTETGSMPAASGTLGGSSLTSVNYKGNPQVFYFGQDKKVHQLWMNGYQWNYNPFNFPSELPTSSYTGGITSTMLWDNPQVFYIGNDNQVKLFSFDGSNWQYNDLGAVSGVTHSIGKGIASTTTIGWRKFPWGEKYMKAAGVLYFATGSSFQTHGFGPQGILWYADAWLIGGAYHNISGYYGAEWEDNCYYQITAPTISNEAYETYEVYYVGTSDGQIRQLMDGNYYTIGKDSGAPAADPAGSIASTMLNGYARIYYIDQNHMVQELAKGDEITWHPVACGALAGAPPASGAQHPGLAAITVNGQPHIYYIAQDDMVHEIYFNGGWFHNAIGALASAPPSQSGGGLTATTYNGYPRVYYLGINDPPYTPSIPSGPTIGTPGDTYSYSTSATDPDEDWVKYTFRWDRRDATLLTQYYPPGSSPVVNHIWSKEGTYNVSAMATDSHGATSGWSSQLAVTIKYPPKKPSIPSGPTSGVTGPSYSYSTSATDPGGDQMKYTFNWGDYTFSETSLVNSGTIASASHIWSTTGTYQVSARATDSHEATSGWSSPLSVSIKAWKSLGGNITSSPSVIVDSLGKTEVWVRGVDNALWVNIDGNWYNKGGVLASEPFAAKDYNGKIHVLICGGDNATWDFIYDPSTSTGHWKGLGKSITARPTAAMEPTSHTTMRVAVRGDDNALWQCDLNINTEAFSWYTNGGDLATSSPYIIFDPSGVQHTLVRGSDNALMDCKGVVGRNGNYIFTWNGLGGNLSSGPTACIEPTTTYVAVFAKGSDNALWTNSVDFMSNPETGTWYRIGGAISSDPFVVADSSGNKIHTYVRGNDFSLLENEFPSSPWSPSENQWHDLGGQILYTPGAVIDGYTQAFAILPNHCLFRNTHVTY